MQASTPRPARDASPRVARGPSPVRSAPRANEFGIPGAEREPVPRLDCNSLGNGAPQGAGRLQRGRAQNGGRGTHKHELGERQDGKHDGGSVFRDTVCAGGI